MGGVDETLSPPSQSEATDGSGSKVRDRVCLLPEGEGEADTFPTSSLGIYQEQFRFFLTFTYLNTHTHGSTGIEHR